MLKHKKAQSLNEYALVLALVAMAGIGMQIYIRQGVQSVVKLTADNLATGGRLESVTVAPEEAANALLNGVKELGLNDFKMINPIEIHTEKGTDVETTAATTREKQDSTQVTGKWAVTYTLNTADIYNSLERQNTSPSVNSQQPVTSSKK